MAVRRVNSTSAAKLYLIIASSGRLIISERRNRETDRSLGVYATLFPAPAQDDLVNEAFRRLVDEVGRRLLAIEAVTPQSNPKVSVVTPVFNRQHTLEYAVRSVQAQTYQNWELIIVDDGSTDDSISVADRFAVSDNRIRVVACSHRGIAASRNEGLKRGSGEIIAYLDSDCGWFPNHLAHVVDAFEEKPEAEVVYLAQLIFDSRDQTCFVRSNRFESDALRHRNLIDINVIAHRRSISDRLGAFDTSLPRYGDWDLLIRYSSEFPPLHCSALGGWYEYSGGDQVTFQINHGHSAYLLIRKHFLPKIEDLRVVYAICGPETPIDPYTATEIAVLKRRGIGIEAHVDLSRRSIPSLPCPILRRDLSESISDPNSHVIHLAAYNQETLRSDLLEEASQPITMTAFPGSSDDSFRWSDLPSVVQGIFRRPCTQLPEEVQKHTLVVPWSFDPDRFSPVYPMESDTALIVVHGGHGPDLEEILTTIDRRLPSFRKVIATAGPTDHLAIVDQLQTRYGHRAEILESSGIPVKIARRSVFCIHLQPKSNLQTPAPEILESMACGCIPLVRADRIVTEAMGSLFINVHQTLREICRAVDWIGSLKAQDLIANRNHAVDVAFEHFCGARNVAPMIGFWQSLVV